MIPRDPNSMWYFTNFFLISNNKNLKNFLMYLKVLSQQTFVGLEDVMKTCSRHVLKTSSTHLQCNNFWSSKTSWRRLQDILKTSRKTSWRCFGRPKIVTLKMSSRHAFKKSWRHISSRYLQDVLETKEMGISVSKKSKWVCI